eukprot:jgi/Botrbrau1/13927/Bobra.136_2s0015.1
MEQGHPVGQVYRPSTVHKPRLLLRKRGRGLKDILGNHTMHTCWRRKWWWEGSSSRESIMRSMIVGSTSWGLSLRPHACMLLDSCHNVLLGLLIPAPFSAVPAVVSLLSTVVAGPLHRWLCHGFCCRG